ncbi:MAG: sigma-70 family RNA polymerase sigma factor [Bacteroidetes bacterium]|nr:sigma-70 family RNA polymerase sigma factor [Bacteroidota bacterium]
MEDLDQIIRGCLRNDRKSQEKLYKQFYVPLFCLCRRFFQNDHEAIESVNDGMMKVFERIGMYNAEKGKFFNWVYTIVRNTALDKFRSSTVLRAESYEVAETIAETDLHANPLVSLEGKDLYILLDRLSPATRVICGLFYIEGYTIKDIAEQLAISSGTVKWHLSESRKKLKSILERHFND